jgi:ABC-2 type transport system permease protein
MSTYIYYLKMRLMIEFSYRFDVFSSIGSNIIILLTTVYLWKAAYQNSDTVNGVSEHEMVTYTIISVILSILFRNTIQNTLNERIRGGNIAVDFLRPINLLISYFADEVGRSLSSFILKGASIFLLASILFELPLPFGLLNLFMFLLSCIFSYLILWLMSAIVGVFAFWVVELGNMGMVKDAIVLFLSGSLVPLWYYPAGIQTISKYLPFQYTFQVPLSIYIGQISIDKALQAISIQIIWTVLFGLMLSLIWKKAQYRTFIQGG